jgi:small multidrug resistance family-3 protein
MIFARLAVPLVVAVSAQVAGVWLVWRAVPDDHGWMLVAAGVIALSVYVAVAARSSHSPFVGIVAAYGAVFLVACLAWGMTLHGEVPDEYDASGAALCICGAGAVALLTRRA